MQASTFSLRNKLFVITEIKKHTNAMSKELIKLVMLYILREHCVPICMWKIYLYVNIEKSLVYIIREKGMTQNYSYVHA